MADAREFDFDSERDCHLRSPRESAVLLRRRAISRLIGELFHDVGGILEAHKLSADRDVIVPDCGTKVRGYYYGPRHILRLTGEVTGSWTQYTAVGADLYDLDRLPEHLAKASRASRGGHAERLFVPQLMPYDPDLILRLVAAKVPDYKPAVMGNVISGGWPSASIDEC